MAKTIAQISAMNAARWHNAKLTREAEFINVAHKLVNAKVRYMSIEAMTGVPWYAIAVIHQREANGRWDANIANGQPFSKVTTIVPKGRGPFPSFEAAAIDALENCEPYAAKNNDWSVGGLLTTLERYNGLGYANRGLPSPYIWSGTDQYEKGKYIRDGVFDPNVVDKQLGCAGLLMMMQRLDPSVLILGGDRPLPQPAPPMPPAPTVPSPPPVQPPAAGGGVWASIWRVIVSLFTKGKT